MHWIWFCILHVLCSQRLFPRAISTSQRICRCIGVQMDACVNSNLPKNSVVAKYSSGWSDIQSSNLKQSLNKYSLPLRALLTSKTQDVSSKPLVGDEKIGVLLLNLGGPETLEDVQPFLFNLFADPVIFCVFDLLLPWDLPSDSHFLNVIKYFIGHYVCFHIS